MSAGGIPGMEGMPFDFSQFFSGMDPNVITPDFIEQMTLGIAMMQAVNGMKQLEIEGERNGLTLQQIENDKQRLLFEAQSLLPFEKQKLQFQEQMQQYQLQESQIGLDISRERSAQAQEGTLQAQEGTLQAQERTKQALYGTRNAQLANAAQYYNTNLARSQSTGRNFVGTTSARRYVGI